MNYSWNPEQFAMHMGMQGMQMNPGMAPMANPPMPPMGNPPMPPMGNPQMQFGMNQMAIEPAPDVQDPSLPKDKLIGPVMPSGFELNAGSENDKANDAKGRNDRRDRGGRDSKGRRRSRSRERIDRNNRDRSHNDRRDRKSKWDTNTDKPNNNDAQSNNVMPDGMMAYGNHGDMGQNMASQNMGGPINNMMMGGGPGMPYGNMMPQQMDMQNMPNMMHSNMAMMPNMMPNMMPGMDNAMNMMPMNQQMMPMMQNQQQLLFFNGGVCLPPVPGTILPNRREKPPGCRTIFVGGIPIGITEENLKEIFTRFGYIQDLKFNKQGFCHVRFSEQQSVEMAFALSGFRIKTHDMNETETMNMLIDYALNRDDQSDFEKNKRRRDPTPPRVEPLNPNTLATISEKIKSEDKFAEAAPTLVGWLERGECNKKNANSFYSLIQASNNQIRRLYSDKMQLDEEFLNLKTTLKEKFAHVVLQFEQVAKILTAAKHQRVSDHFNKQQRRNIEMWLRMTEDLENIKEEFNATFDEDEVEKSGKKGVPEDKYEELKQENANLIFELEGYKNEVHIAKDEAERKFEKFKAHFIAQQALQSGGKQVFLSPPPLPPSLLRKETPPPPPDHKPEVSQYEAKLISILTAFLLVHPLGSKTENLLTYVKTIVPNANASMVNNILKKYTEIFKFNASGSNETWTYITFDNVKNNA